MKRRAISTLCAVLLLATLEGASGAPAKEKSLYDRLGGQKGHHRGTIEVFLEVQSLEYAEQLVCVFHVETNSVVPDED